MTIRVSQNTLPGSCGTGIIYGFERGSRGWGHPLGDVFVGGVGLHCAAFVSTRVCRDVYEHQKAKYKIVFQSEKRINSNSRRGFIFVVYDRKAKVSDDMNKDYEFPFRPRG